MIILPDQRHKQVPAKVTALVDEGIKDLVEVLNTFDGVQTYESCQGNSRHKAFVCMEYGKSDDTAFSEIADFTNKLASALSKLAGKSTGISPDPIYDLTLSIEWWGNKKSPFVYIEIPPDSLSKIASIFVAVRREFENDKKNIQP